MTSPLIVAAHADPGSLTQYAARGLRDRIGSGTTMAHLAEGGFDSRFTAQDCSDRLD